MLSLFKDYLTIYFSSFKGSFAIPLFLFISSYNIIQQLILNTRLLFTSHDLFFYSYITPLLILPTK